MMHEKYIFEAVIKESSQGNGAWVEFPYDVEEAYGHNGMVKVEAKFDGYRYRGVLAKMGPGCHIIGITKAIRKAIGKDIGDTIEVSIQKDDRSRLEAIPEMLQKALDANGEAEAFFNTLTDSQKNKFIKHITLAKKQETMDRRLEKCIIMLNNKEKMK